MVPGKEITYTIDMLIEKMLGDGKQYDLSKVVAAYELAAKAHKDQVRSSGEPYISHPVAVAYILLEQGMDTDSICAALLHDVVEDTDTTLDELRREFGVDVAELVDGLTKINKIDVSSPEEAQAKNVEKLLYATDSDIRVIIIKIADRLHNIRTLHYRPEYKQRNTARETMDIYVPIAERLGMSKVKDELSELSIYYLDRFGYNEIEQLLERKKSSREAFIAELKSEISARYREDGLDPPYIEGRVKSISSLYRKYFEQNKNFEEIYDKYAVRIIVEKKQECYIALGIIHDMYAAVPNRFKDYIATPKQNGYQSLHTTMMSRKGIMFEVQIRTWDMHREAENGIAAHWKYKENAENNGKLERKIAWMRQLLEEQQNSDKVEDIVDSIKQMKASEIHVFTPKSKMVHLPIGSTVIDFAYDIHPEIGNHMIGAKVGGKLVSFDYQLSTGEVCEIITDKNRHPNRQWLDLCRTTKARNRIKRWLKQEQRPENIEVGKREFRQALERSKIAVPEEDYPEFVKDIMEQGNCAGIDDFYAEIGYGELVIQNFIAKLHHRYLDIYTDQDAPTPIGTSEVQITLPTKEIDGIVIDGKSNISVKFAQCCNPLPGDDIIGFITKGHGLSIHKIECDNYKNALKYGTDVDRWVSAYWPPDVRELNTPIYRVTLDIVASPDDFLITSISRTLQEKYRVPINRIADRHLKNGNHNVVCEISISGKQQVENILIELRKIPTIISAERAG
jgi:GTP pyrophosphokinase